MDIIKSIFYYSLAAKQNSVKALNQLGHFYYDGKFLKRDINKSIQYFTSAVHQIKIIQMLNLFLLICI